MKISSRIILASVALALFFNIPAAAEAEAQILLPILKKIESHQKSLSTLRSKITMEKYDAELRETDVYEGTTHYSRAGGSQMLLRIDFTKPAVESLFYMNGQYAAYRPRLNQAIMGKIDRTKDQTRGLLYFLSMSMKELKANYLIKYHGTETIKNGTQTRHLSITPKYTSTYKSIELWVDGSGMPIQGKVLERNNDSTTILLSDLKKNETINLSIFRPLLPKSTKIITDNINCPCFKPGNAGDALKYWSDAVFSGRVVDVSNSDYTFQTERIWKGGIAGKVILRSYAENACTPKLKKGERYVVFARKISVEGKTILGISPCNFTSNLATEGGKKVLKEIGKGTPVKKAAVRKKRRL